MPTSQIGSAPSAATMNLSTANSTLTSPTEEARLNNATPAPFQRNSISPPNVGGASSVAIAGAAVKRPNETLARQQQSVECDYDVSPTDLYQAIEAKQWEYVHRLFQTPASGGISIAKPQASTWVVRKEQNGKLRWRLLPIHAAIIFQAPADIVELLLSEYPEGASCKDDQGMLPLHLAMRNTPSNFSIIEELMTVHPAAVYVKDRKGRTPLQGGMAAIKNSEAKSALQVMDLYTHISTAGEKQRWLAEQRQAADQRLATTQEQHIQRLTALKSEFEKEYQELEDAHIRDTMDLQNQLEVMTEREQRLRKQMAELTNKLQGSHYQNMQHREFELKEQNQELRLLITKLLDQQSSLVLSMEKQSWEQKDRHEKRAALFQQCMHMEDEISMSTNKHTTAWKNALNDMHDDITQRITTLYTSSGPSPPTNQQKVDNNNNNNNSNKNNNININKQRVDADNVADEKKEDSVQGDVDTFYPSKSGNSDEGSYESNSSSKSGNSKSSNGSRRKPREPKASVAEEVTNNDNAIVEVGQNMGSLCGMLGSAALLASTTTTAAAIDP